jgi:hypothetical protein
MKQASKRGWIVWVIIVAIILIADYFNYRGRVKRLESSLSKEEVPPPNPSMGKPLFYSIQFKKWIYSSESGAIAPRNANEPYEDHETFLKRNLPIYKKKTYWGEEWDEETGKEQDEIWDDEGDDYEPNR